MMISHPKPRAAERKLANYERKRALREYRHGQYLAAMQRDGGICVICRKRAAVDVHHVYGRGCDFGDWREQYTNMMSVCRRCHPQPIKHKPAGPKLAWIEEILEKVNA